MKTSKKILLAIAGVFALTLACAFAVMADETGPTIKTQPQDAKVEFPSTATFTVKAEEDGSSEGLTYQWTLVNNETEYVLECASAKTAALEVTTTPYMGNEGNNEYYCTVTDKDGNSVKSDTAAVYVTNADDTKTSAVYVGDKAIVAGETLDLEKEGIGKGKVTFASNGKKLTFDSVEYSNAELKDIIQLAGPCITYVSNDTSLEALELEIVGENTITNTYYEEEYAEGGFALSFDFCRSEDIDHIATLTVTGDGTLNVNGGTHIIDANSSIIFDGVKVNLKSIGSYISAGIETNMVSTQLEVGTPDVKLTNGAEITMDVNGAAIFSDGTITIENSKLDVKETIRSVVSGATVKNTLLANGSITMDKAEVSIEVGADKDQFKAAGSAIASSGVIYAVGSDTNEDAEDEDDDEDEEESSGADIVIKNGSKVDVTFKIEKGDRMYCYYASALNTTDSITIEKSTVNAAVEGEEAILYVNTVTAEKDITITDSTVKATANGCGTCDAISASGKVKIKDSKVTATAEAQDYELEAEEETEDETAGTLELLEDEEEEDDEADDVVEGKAGGILGYGVEINLNNSGDFVKAEAEDGQAIISGIENTNEKVSYTEGYTPTSLLISGTNVKKTTVDEKTEQTVNLFGYELSGGDDEYLKSETMYSKGATSAAADNTLIKAAESETPSNSSDSNSSAASDTVKITFQIGTGGYVTGSNGTIKSGDVIEVKKGSNYIFKPVANSGYSVLSVTVNGATYSPNSVGSYTIENITVDTKIVVTFRYGSSTNNNSNNNTSPYTGIASGVTAAGAMFMIICAFIIGAAVIRKERR